MLSGDEVKTNSSRFFFSGLFEQRSSAGVHKMEIL